VTLATRSEAPESPSADRSTIVYFCLGTFFYFASMYLYVPVLSVYARSMGASLTIVGLVVSAYGFTQLVTRVPIGFFSDVIGRRKPFVIAGILAAALGCLGLAWSPAPLGLVASRTVIGFGGATWVAFTVLFASYFPLRRVPHALALITFVSGAAQAAAGLAGGFMSQALGTASTFYGGAVLALLGLITMLPIREKLHARPTPMSTNRLATIARTPSLLIAAAIATVNVLVYFATTLSFTPIYARGLGASDSALGLLFTVAVVFATIANLVSATVAARIGDRAVIVIGMAMAGIATAFVPFTLGLPTLALTQVVAGFGRGLCDPTLLAQSMRSVPAHERATATGVYQAIYAVGMFGGPFFGGVVADAFGLSSVFLITAVLCGMAAVLGLAVGRDQARP
jgi:MFS family permease